MKKILLKLVSQVIVSKNETPQKLIECLLIKRKASTDSLIEKKQPVDLEIRTGRISDAHTFWPLRFNSNPLSETKTKKLQLKMLLKVNKNVI